MKTSVKEDECSNSNGKKLRFILAKHPDLGWALINGFEGSLIQLTEEEKTKLSKDDSCIIRSPSNGYVLASYDISDRCNYNCIHCYLGDARTTCMEVSLEEHIRTIDAIEQAGVLWLQFSGGEPLLSRSFYVLYERAWRLGMIVSVQTNGALLGENEYVELFREYRPANISVSLYGATEKTYATVTRRIGAWSKFVTSMEKALKNDLPINMLIIKMKQNEHELEQMIEFASRFGRMDVLDFITPTLDADKTPVTHCSIHKFHGLAWKNCGSGKRSFHVTSRGAACICKMARSPSVDISSLKKLPVISSSLLKLPKACSVCELYDRCGICPPVYKILREANQLPERRCYGEKRRG